MKTSIVHDVLCGEFNYPKTDWGTAADVLYWLMRDTPYDCPESKKSRVSEFKRKYFRSWRRLKRHLVYRSVVLFGLYLKLIN